MIHFCDFRLTGAPAAAELGRSDARREDKMSVPGLPMDLVDFLRGKEQPQLATEGYGTLNLVPLEQLRVEQQLVTPTLSDFAAEDPHDSQGGYEVPAVNLVSGGTSDMGKWYAWL